MSCVLNYSPMMTRMFGLLASQAICVTDRPMITPSANGIVKGLFSQLSIGLPTPVRYVSFSIRSY
jgi:hypothetical protein